MRMQRFIRSTPGRWLSSLCCYALLVAPFGCQFQSLLLGSFAEDEALTTTASGLFINEDLSGALLIVAGMRGVISLLGALGLLQLSRKKKDDQQTIPVQTVTN